MIGLGLGLGLAHSKRNTGPALIPATGAALVYDFAQPSGVVLNGGNIASVVDQTGNGNTATQTTAASQPPWNASDPACNNLGTCNPTTGTPSLNLPAGFTLAQPYTIILVGVTGASGFQKFICNPGSTLLQVVSSSGTSMIFKCASTQITATKSTTTKHIYVFQGNVAASTTTIYVDSSSTTSATGTQSGSGSPSGLTLLNDAGSSQLIGSLAWLGIWLSIYSGSNLTSTVNALGTRYGIAVT